MERNCNSDMSEELQKQYYLIRFKILQETYYAIWYTDDIDGFLLDKDRSEEHTSELQSQR